MIKKDFFSCYKKVTLMLVAFLFASTSIFAANIVSQTNGDWSNPVTWVGGVVPTAADNVTINDIVTVDVASACNDLTINIELIVNANLTVNGNLTLDGIGTLTLNAFTMNVTGSITSNGTVNTSAGSILNVSGNFNNDGFLNGGAGSTLDVTGTFDNTVYADFTGVDLPGSQPTGVGLLLGLGEKWIAPGVWEDGTAPLATENAIIMYEYAVNSNFVCNNLTINLGVTFKVLPGKTLTVDGDLNNNGTLILKSPNDLTASGSLLTNGDIINNGNMIAERYITPNVYHLIGSPLNASVDAELPFGLDYVWTYNEAYNGAENDYAWNQLPTHGATVYPTIGYLIKSTTDFNSNFVISFAGTFNNDDVTFNLSEVYQGYNLITNPYPSAIDWDAPVGWSKTDVKDGIWIWNGASYSTYGTYVGVNGGTNMIPSMQGFFVKKGLVKSKAPLGLRMDNNVRVHNTVPYLKNAKNDLIKLTISGNGMTDEIALYFNEEESDFEKFMSWTANLPQIYSIEGDKKVAINKLQDVKAEQSVKLGTTCDISGNYTISANEFTFNNLSAIVLEDTKTGIFTTMSKDASYTFAYEKGEVAERFVLHFNYSPTTDITNAKKDINIYANAKNIYFNNIDNQTGIVNVYNVIGQQVLTTDLKSVVSTNLQTGVYVVEVISNNQKITNKIVIN